MKIIIKVEIPEVFLTMTSFRLKSSDKNTEQIRCFCKSFSSLTFFLSGTYFSQVEKKTVSRKAKKKEKNEREGRDGNLRGERKRGEYTTTLEIR